LQISVKITTIQKFGTDVNKHFETFNKNLQTHASDKKSFLDHNLFTQYKKAGATNSDKPNSARGEKDEEKPEKATVMNQHAMT
jgi:hypothetical protein